MTTAFLSAWQAAFLDVTAKSLLLLLLAGAAAGLLRRASAAQRHLVWQLLFFCLLALPLLSLALPVWRIPLRQFARPAVSAATSPSVMPMPALPAPPVPGTTHEPVSAAPAPVPPNALPSQATAETAAAAPSAPQPVETVWQHWAGWEASLWLIGLLFVLARTLAGLLGVWRLGRGGQRVNSERLTALADDLAREAGCKRPVTLVTAAHLPAVVPMTWGLAHPMILLPLEAEQWTSERLRSVLLHEMAHIQRGDWLTQILTQVTCALYWFHPPVWWAARRLQMESERACDDRALASGVKPSDYARHLLEVVRTLKTENGPPRGTVAMAQRAGFESRLQAILNERLSRKRTNRALAATLIVAATGALLPLAALHVGAGTPLRAQALPGAQDALPSPQTALPEVAMPETDLHPLADTDAPALSSTHNALTLAPGRLNASADLDAPQHSELADVTWGVALEGLQAGLRVTGARRTFAPGERVPLTLYIRNVSDREIAFAWTLNAYDEQKPTVEAVKVPGVSGEQKVTGAWLTGLPSEVSLVLQPGEAFRFEHPPLVLGKIEGKGLEDIPYLEDPKPGLYALSQHVPYAIRPLKDFQESLGKVEGDKGNKLFLQLYKAPIVTRDGRSYTGKGVVSGRIRTDYPQTPEERRLHPNFLTTKPVEFEIGEKGVAPLPAKAGGETNPDTDKTVWGKPEEGLQAGLFTAGGRRAYRIGETVVFGLKLRNVSDRAISLSLQVPEHKNISLTDPDAIRLYAYIGHGAPFTLEPGEEKAVPGETWTYLLKPPGWMGPAEENGPTVTALLLQPGKYTVSAPMNLWKEDSPNAGTGLRASPGTLEIEIAAGNAPKERLGLLRNSPEPKDATGPVVWGKTLNGLQLGIGFAAGKRSYIVGDEVTAELWYRNVSDRPLSFSCRMFPYNAEAFNVTDTKGNHINMESTFFTGMEPLRPQTLQPGASVKVGHPHFVLRPEGRAKGSNDTVLIAGPGRYRLQVYRDARPQFVRDFDTLLASGILEFDVAPR